MILIVLTDVIDHGAIDRGAINCGLLVVLVFVHRLVGKVS